MQRTLLQMKKLMYHDISAPQAREAFVLPRVSLHVSAATTSSLASQAPSCAQSSAQSRDCSHAPSGGSSYAPIASCSQSRAPLCQPSFIPCPRSSRTASGLYPRTSSRLSEHTWEDFEAALTNSRSRRLESNTGGKEGDGDGEGK